MFLTSPYIDQVIAQATPERYTRLRNLRYGDISTVIRRSTLKVDALKRCSSAALRTGQSGKGQFRRLR
jgi:hypothetical protein